MWNPLSVQWLGKDETLEWYQKIKNFQVFPKYILPGRDIGTDPGMPALGPEGNILPKDRNVTLFFDYQKGCKSYYEYYLKNYFPQELLQLLLSQKL